MSRSPSVLTNVTLLEDRLTALLARIDTAAGVLTEQAVRETTGESQARNAASAASLDNAALEQLRQLSQQLERQEASSLDDETTPAEWLAPLQEQLSRIEQRVAELRNPAPSPATFG